MRKYSQVYGISERKFGLYHEIKESASLVKYRERVSQVQGTQTLLGQQRGQAIATT